MVHKVALVSVSLDLSQTAAYTAGLQIWVSCIAWCVCIPQLSMALTLCLPTEDGQAELIWLAYYFPRRFTRP